MKLQCIRDDVLRLLSLLMLCAVAAGCASLATGNGTANDDPNDNLTVSQRVSQRLEQGKQHKDAGRIECDPQVIQRPDVHAGRPLRGTTSGC